MSKVDTDALLNMSLDEIIEAQKQKQKQPALKKPNKKGSANSKPAQKGAGAAGKLVQKRAAQAQQKRSSMPAGAKQRLLGAKPVIAKKRPAVKVAGGRQPQAANKPRPRPQAQAAPQKGVVTVTIKKKGNQPGKPANRPQGNSLRLAAGKPMQAGKQQRMQQGKGGQPVAYKPVNAGVKKQQAQKRSGQVVVSIQGQQRGNSNGGLANRSKPAKPVKQGFNSFGVKLPV